MLLLKKAITRIPASINGAGRADRKLVRKQHTISVASGSASPQEIHRRVLADGCCLIRNVLSPAMVLDYRDRIDHMRRSVTARLEAGESIGTYERTHIFNHQFTAEYGEEHSFFNLVRHPLVLAVLDNMFGPQRYSLAPLETCARLIEVPSHRRTELSFNPLRTHIDGIYHRTWPFFAINVWVPFRACGAGTKAPGLMVYPVDFTVVRRYLDFDTPDKLQAKIFSEANTQPMIPLYPAIDRMFAAEHIEPIAPHFEIGDLMIVNSWTPHGTYWNKTMSEARSSVEIRLQGETWDPLPAETDN